MLPRLVPWRSSGWLLGLKYWGFSINYNTETTSLTCRRDSAKVPDDPDHRLNVRTCRDDTPPGKGAWQLANSPG